MYVVSVALAVIAAAVCGFVGFRVLRLLRTCRVTASMVAARTNDRVGLLRAFDNDAGWRIDYQVATPGLAGRAQWARVERAVEHARRWSDHAPVTVRYGLR